jgi:hypothetical protein
MNNVQIIFCLTECTQCVVGQENIEGDEHHGVTKVKGNTEEMSSGFRQTDYTLPLSHFH